LPITLRPLDNAVVDLINKEEKNDWY
jgi:hypothetical protein